MIEKILNKLFKFRVIHNCEKAPYLHRWYLVRREWLAIFVHKFVRSDEDRALHDHPWSFIVIPIWRGYIEHNERTRFLDPEKDTLRVGDEFEMHSKDDWCRLVNLAPGETFIPGFVYRRKWENKTRVLPLLGIRFRRAEYRHRVELLKGPEERECLRGAPTAKDPEGPVRGFAVWREDLPSWSLFIRFRKRREWGFWPKKGFVNWQKWWNDLCED